MLDFLKISTRRTKNGIVEIYPKFIICKSADLMIRGGDFYAIWVEEKGLWSTDEQDALELIDKELQAFSEENKKKYDENIKVLYMWDSDSGMIDKWHKYCQKQSRDSYKPLDEKLIFSNSKTNKKDYASKRLNYPLESGDCPSWNKLISTLYSEEERHKIEWAIGSIVTGDSKKIQKFMVLYGAAGTGKSTILNVIQQLFDGYYSVFDAKALGSSSNSFALEAFKTNPLVAIQHDGDLSKIEDNTRLNSLVSHEKMMVNEKFKATYPMKFNAFLLMGTNKPVKITDGKSGLLRRLIDVTPSGEKLPSKEYREIMKKISFELGSIANHCKEVYLEDPKYYDDYVPVNMMGASNDFYNYVMDSYSVFKKENGTTLKAAWEMYKVYCEEAKVPYPMSQRNFKEELKNYFWDFDDRFNLDDGTRVRSYYYNFRVDKFEAEKKPVGKKQKNKPKTWLKFNDSDEKIFDDFCSDCPAQYANNKETPNTPWDEVETVLSDIDPCKLHYVKVPENHIVIDFDLKGEDGEKSFERNLEEASKWPETYAELSKSGSGIHLHYIYNGDVTRLSRTYSDDVEIKVFTGKSSLRRKLTKWVGISIATISSGLPLREEKMVNKDVVQTEKGLRTTINKCLNKEIHSGTKPNVDFIFKILDEAYQSGMHYDVSDMYNDILTFAANSSHQAMTCMKLVNKMHFKSDDISEPDQSDAEIVFYDVEVFPNLFLVNYKKAGEGKPVVRLINPTPSDIEDLIKYRLVGFNCRRYDNHILYACLLGKTNKELYDISQKIISSQKGDRNNGLYGEAYNISYTDVYDFAAKKQSLKKWEIELGIHHQELGLPWDEPVDESLWTQVAEYCDNDVIATEAVFNHLKADFLARQILADLAGGSSCVNDTTNTLTTRIIFGSNRNPQDSFNYRNMGDISACYDAAPVEYVQDVDEEYTCFDKLGRPVFPGYSYELGKSIYREEEVGEGGYVYAEPGMYGNVALLDIASMHPSSIIAERLFGDEYTSRFADIRNARVAIKHGDFDTARTMLGGKLAPYLDDEGAAGDLAQALKIAINSVYGLTSATFPNAFRDPRNIDNIVAKRGALFMVNLKHEVKRRGFTVAHIKTDSIKIPDATPEIIQFVMDYGEMYGYTFEHEATYERMCLVNNAVYIAKYKDGKHAGEWTATGKQFAVPYIFKTLFSHEPLEFSDLCETFAVTKGDLYLDTNETLPDVSDLEKELAKMETKYKKGLISDTTINQVREELEPQIAEGHSYHFVGRVGQFCPMAPGSGGGILWRKQGEKYYAPPGTTKPDGSAYRWMESEMVANLYSDSESNIDMSFYEELANDAIDAISTYGDYEWFVSDDPYIPDFISVPDGSPDEIPFDQPYNTIG